MSFDHFMRLVVFFDLPVVTKQEVREYRKFVKYLSNEGYIRLQYSVYGKLCINKDAIITASKKLKGNTPVKGDVRFTAMTEKQYLSISNVNGIYSLQEQVTTIDRTVIIGGMNENEDSE